MKLKKIIFISFILSLSVYSCDYKIPAFAGSYCYSENYSINKTSDSVIKLIVNFKEKYPAFKTFQVNIDGSMYEPGEYENLTNLPDDTVLHIFRNDTAYEIRSRRTIETTERTDSSIWYSFYFHFSDIKADIHCVINLRGAQKTTVMQLTGVTYSENFGSWKTINRSSDISRKENRMIKKKFEAEILDKIFAGKWKHKRWYN
jgi:hypothetical protein